MSEPSNRDFGRRIKGMRERRGLTQAWVATEAGRSKSYFCDLEAGRREPGAETLERIADVLGVTMHELWLGLGRCEGY